jgi:ATP-dependent helicase/nuclease subunit B
LAEVRAALSADPSGLPLLFLAPKQSTFQLERQLLSDPQLAGFSRLQILSFDRLAQSLLADRVRECPPLLDEEGRLMVLRAMLGRHAGHLQQFHAAARLPGFAQTLSQVLRECQQNGVSPTQLQETARREHLPAALRSKLQDVALLYESYRQWQRDQGFRDLDDLLAVAADILRDPLNRPYRLAGLWLDGFAEMTDPELGFLMALIPCCQEAVLTFCLPGETSEEAHWLSTWSVVTQTYRRCRTACEVIPGSRVVTEVLPGGRDPSRFRSNPTLRQLAVAWAFPGAVTQRWGEAASGSDRGLEPFDPVSVAAALRLVSCRSPEEEVLVAAREIRQFVLRGGRFRDCAVIVRSLERYHDLVRREFRRYEIPCFIDRRESLAHHPLAELTRHALRGVVFGWRQEDWFGALRSGLVGVDEDEVDALENEARASGWQGTVWSRPLPATASGPPHQRLEAIRRRSWQALGPLQQALSARRGSTFAGQDVGGVHIPAAALTTAVRSLWSDLGVEEQLLRWHEDAALSAPWTDTVHASVWRQMRSWLESVDLAFEGIEYPLAEWLPIVEVGLSHLTVGILPPSLDQVLIGAIDRARNPELKLVVLLGLNQGVFPGPPPAPPVFSEDERAQLETARVRLGAVSQRFLGRERYYGYIALTRASERLVMTWAAAQDGDQPLSPSPFVTDTLRLFPESRAEEPGPPTRWRECVHPIELSGLLAQARGGDLSRLRECSPLAAEFLTKRIAAWAELRRLPVPPELDPVTARTLYGSPLLTSVTALEQFAACPFRFFVYAGLKCRPRRTFDLGHRELGDFQHQVLSAFHRALPAQGCTWHTIAPAEARTQVIEIAARLAATFAGGRAIVDARRRQQAVQTGRELARVVEVLVTWMQQYEFEPCAAELRFAPDGEFPPWTVDLSESDRLALMGSIDRVDLWRADAGGPAYGVVIDYKSSPETLDRAAMAAGLQLQLPAYLNVLCHLPQIRERWAIDRVQPAGMFYVGLRRAASRGQSRQEVLAEDDHGGRAAHQHRGRFDAELLTRFDRRSRSKDGPLVGDQFHFRLSARTGKIDARNQNPVSSSELRQLLDQTTQWIRHFGRAILAGDVRVDPYRDGQRTPCEFCDFASICRIDPWSHSYRALPPVQAAQAAD